ncbi:uncharacterized protein LOC106662097 [Cimex lectularius]|uniref:Uncharacterized protein n=1 Tax=Cimex lectularius TaxID=79782 RepID=A0A8I6R8T5_CIMLE|nr:uncharacterized protein LOC106662097 [Cimex lectularius]
MGSYLIIAVLFVLKTSNAALVFDFLEDLSCPPGGNHINSTLVPYYIDYLTDDYPIDMHNHMLSSLQDFLYKDFKYVTLAVDHKLHLPYGTKVCIPAMNHHYLKFINFEIRDTSEELDSRGYEQFNVFVSSKKDTYDKVMNRDVGLFIYF